jgi:pilus assembly protein FimV
MRPFPGVARMRSISARLSPGPLRRHRVIAIATLVGLPAVAHALGLGPATGSSVLGETLQLTIPLTGSLDGPLDKDCIAVRRPTDPIEPDYYPRDLAVHLDKSAGTLRVLVASRSAIRQPLIQFGISITCGYNLGRDYVIAVSPRNRTPRPMPVPATSGAQAAAITASPAAAATPATPTVTPDGLPGERVALDRGMTLEQLARKHFPGPLRQGRFMRWVIEANPQLFANSSDVRRQHLAAGTRVLIPIGIPPRRPGDYAHGSSPLDKFYKGAAVDSVGRTAIKRETKREARRETKHDQDRLVVGSGSGVARNDKETVALVQRLTGMLEQQVAAQAANAERIRQLEASTEDLKARIAQAEAAARLREAQFQAQLQAQEQAARRAQDKLAERAWWQMAIGVLVGGALAAALLQGFRLWMARRPEPDLPALVPPPETTDSADDEPPPAAAEREQAPVPPPPPAQPAIARTMPPPARKQKPADDPLDFEPPSFLQNEKKRVTTGSALTMADVAVQEVPDPAKAAIELANIMTSMGLTESAAQTLVDHIRENPRQSLPHWLKLLELHRLNDKREDYERSTLELRQHFNVQADDWHGAAGAGRGNLEDYPHIRAEVTRLWGNSGCVKYLHALLMDNREGTRSGFPLSVAEEILLLIAIQSDVQ